jgi:hypothetical protein
MMKMLRDILNRTYLNTRNNMNIRQITPHILAATALFAPLAALAHGGVDDGHVEEEVVVAVTSGASALLKPFSPEWWGLLAVSSILTAGLSYGVWKYLQVPKYKKPDTPSESAPDTSK